MVNVCEVCPSDIYPLRHRILRPGQPLANCFFPFDDSATHIACHVEGQIVAILSLFNEPLEGVDTKNAWRIRGVATDQNFRRRGFASRLLVQAQAHVIEKAGSIIWCNARVNAIDLYVKHGFQTRGKQFHIADIGVHVVMAKPLTR